MNEVRPNFGRAGALLLFLVGGEGSEVWFVACQAAAGAYAQVQLDMGSLPCGLFSLLSICGGSPGKIAPSGEGPRVVLWCRYLGNL